ncbi:hypothetical protein Gogos_020497 [Gossypium gossypioides]|uniref:Uncharacterized protein n=1 Tax=Gossypium gossypioides TaxID=34282 RepID=A0A7J9D1A5_GOSGO|nr:hypothetical protein [Gossypium gossypioides]
MGSVARADWSETCEQLLGNVSNKFRGSWIEMGWLEDNFKTIEASASTPTKLDDIRLALYQQTEEERRYDYLPTHEPFLTPELVISLDYLDWLKHNGKPYLLPTAKKSRQLHCRRRRRRPINLRLREHTVGGLTFSLALQEDPIVVQPPSQYGSYIFIANPVYYTETSQHEPSATTSIPSPSVGYPRNRLFIQEEMYNGQLVPRRGQPQRKEMNMEIIIEVHVKLKEKDDKEPLDQIVLP